jgi:beta-hydroxyacyl-ACP dehydratase FabZ
MIDVKEIMRILPHRYPFLLVDRIERLKEGEEIVGIKNVTINEPFFSGHFPGHPIMPGVLILEAMAQVGGVLAFHSLSEKRYGSLVYLTGIDRVRFRKPVLPGDQLRLHLTVIRHKQRVFKMKGEAYVQDSMVAEAELMAAVEDGRAEEGAQ